MGKIGMHTFKESLWDNIHKKRKEGRPMRKPGSKGAPTDQDFKNAGESVDKDMSNMVCEDCGCSFGEPVPDCNCPHDSNGSNWIDSDTNEALNMQQRLQRSRSARRNKQKMARGRKRAERKTATPDVINKRAVKAARKALYKKLTKGATDLSPGRKKELEARLDKPNMKNIVQRLAKKLRPKIRGLEKERRANRNKS